MLEWQGCAVVRQLWWFALFGLCACATNPYDASTDTAARLVGKRAIIYPERRMKEFVYFMQINKLDLRNRWGDYPHDIYVPPGNNKLLVVCEWYGMISAEPVAKAVKQIKQRFVIGHQYEFRSEPTGEGMCETHFKDLTRAERNAEIQEKPAPPKAVETTTAGKKSSSTTRASSTSKTKKKPTKRRWRGR